MDSPRRIYGTVTMVTRVCQAWCEGRGRKLVALPYTFIPSWNILTGVMWIAFWFQKWRGKCKEDGDGLASIAGFQRLWAVTAKHSPDHLLSLIEFSERPCDHSLRCKALTKFWVEAWLWVTVTGRFHKYYVKKNYLRQLLNSRKWAWLTGSKLETQGGEGHKDLAGCCLLFTHTVLTPDLGIQPSSLSHHTHPESPHRHSGPLLHPAMGKVAIVEEWPCSLTQILDSNCIVCGSRGRMGKSRGLYAPLPGKSQPRKSYLCLCPSILVFSITSHSIRLSPAASVFPQALDQTWLQVPLTLLTPTASQTSIPPTFRKIAKPSWRQLTASYNLPQRLTLCMMRL